MLRHTTSHFDTPHQYIQLLLYTPDRGITKPRGDVIGGTPTYDLPARIRYNVQISPKLNYTIIKIVEMPSLLQACSHYAAIATVLSCSRCSLSFIFWRGLLHRCHNVGLETC